MKIIIGDQFEALNCPQAGVIVTVTTIRYYKRRKLVTVIGDGCGWHNAPASEFRNKKYWRKL